MARFEPIRTERLILRPPVVADTESFFRRHADPKVARYQDWEMPYPRERAVERIESLAAMDGPPDDEGWWGITVVKADAPDQIVGDMAVGISWEGRTGEIGYSFEPDQWGRGYAAEAARALVRWLFEGFGVSRVEGKLHPDNPASARVLEACGLVFEGRTKLSFWVGDENSDDVTYGVTVDEWRAWRDRPRHRPEQVTLEPVTEHNVGAVGRLATHWTQQRFVSPMGQNFCHALVPGTRNGHRVVPWYRAVVADVDVVGFLMVADRSDADPEPYLWRFLIDRVHQRRGIGAMALDVYEQICRDRGDAGIMVSWREGAGSPAPFYLARGYVPTGAVDDGEIVARKPLAGA